VCGRIRVRRRRRRWLHTRPRSSFRFELLGRMRWPVDDIISLSEYMKSACVRREISMVTKREMGIMYEYSTK
jgi:hypothetical protein